MDRISRIRASAARWAAILALAAAGFAPALAPACPNCKETVARDDAAVAVGYNRSVLFMLGLVMALSGSMAGLVTYIVRSEGSASDPRSPPAPTRDD